MQAKTKQSSENELQINFLFERSDLHLEYSLLGVVVHLDGFPTTGDPGGPALPNCIVRVALPAQTELAEIQAEAFESVHVNHEALPIAPIQFPQPGRSSRDDRNEKSYSRPLEDAYDPREKFSGLRQNEKEFVEPFPNPPYTPPNPRLYTQAARRPTAHLLQTKIEGVNSIATLNINPVHLKEDGLLEFSTQINLTLSLKPASDRDEQHSAIPEHITSRSQAMRQVALARLTVINPEDVFDFSDYFPFWDFETDYLIITDNQTWNAETVSPIGPAGGDLVTSFERLADWKRKRGLKSRVVTISNIVADKYGNFRSNSRDLQEVIRKFLKKAYTDWGVAWVLLGGDTNILPVRQVAGGREGNIDRQGTNPPPDNKSYWAGTYLRMHVVNPGVWWAASTENLLVRPDNGLLIPYDAAGTSNSTTRGWYFTTNDTYNTRTSTPTEFVRVNGPAAEINANLQFLYTWNTIPTDLYYSSLIGPHYNQPGQHDWDLTNNGIYGQHNASVEMDGINYTPTISLGRSPVRTAAEADAFVNKVIAYEKFEQPDSTPLDPDWTGRIIFVSSNWGARFWIGPTNTIPPEDNKYQHTAGQNHSLIKLKKTPDWNWSLLAYINDSDVRLLPYRTDAAAVGRGWYFARSENDLSPFMIPIMLANGDVLNLPLISQWIAVYGTSDELAPAGYVFNNIVLDGSLADQENLRLQMKSEMPGFNQIERFYEDVEDMTPSQVSAAPLERLASGKLRDSLNQGPHIVSLSGHGNSNGCCTLSRGMADGLTNGFTSFIAYADSCLTNQFDGNAMSEHLLKNANGGAVAYIGNTRFSWIGLGDDLQRRFFNQWGTLGGNAHIGLLNDTRSEFLNKFHWASVRWAIFSLSLMGDPEMPLWWHKPLLFKIPEVILVDKFRVIIDLPDPPDPYITFPYNKAWGKAYVTLRQDRIEKTVMADANNTVEFPLTEFESGHAEMLITSPGCKPIVEDVQLIKSQKDGKGCSLFSWLLGLMKGIIDKMGRHE